MDKKLWYIQVVTLYGREVGVVAEFTIGDYHKDARPKLDNLVRSEVLQGRRLLSQDIQDVSEMLDSLGYKIVPISKK